MSESEFNGEQDSRSDSDHESEVEGVPNDECESGCEPEIEGTSEGALSVPEDVLRLDGVEWADFDPDLLVEVATLAQRLIGRVQAVQLKAVAELRKRRGNERETADEVGLALAVGYHQADRQIELASQITRRFPRLLAALERGDVDATKAAKVVETGALLSDEHADQLDAEMESLLAGRDGASIQRSARYRVDKLDPEGAAERVRRCRDDRRLELRFAENGMADLCAYLPAETACAIYSRIDAIAKSDKTRRDERSLDAIRADVLTELLLGKRHSFRQVQIQVTVPVTTLLGARDLPATSKDMGRSRRTSPGRWRQIRGARGDAYSPTPPQASCWRWDATATSHPHSSMTTSGPATNAVWCRAATGQLVGATPTTTSNGTETAPPTRNSWRVCAADITGSRTDPGGTSSSTATR